MYWLQKFSLVLPLPGWYNMVKGVGSWYCQFLQTVANGSFLEWVVLLGTRTLGFKSCIVHQKRSAELSPARALGPQRSRATRPLALKTRLSRRESNRATGQAKRDSQCRFRPADMRA